MWWLFLDMVEMADVVVVSVDGGHVVSGYCGNARC